MDNDERPGSPLSPFAEYLTNLPKRESSSSLSSNEEERRAKWNAALSVGIPSPNVLVYLAISVAAFSLMVYSVSRPSSSTSSSSSGITSSSKPYSSSGSSVDYTQSLVYSFSRVGYDPLSYFDPDDNSILQYSFLQSYDGIIEPNVPMQLEVYNDDVASTNKFKFGVCPADSTGNACEHGVKYDVDTTEMVSVTLSCEPFDELTVNIMEYDDDGELVREISGTVVCMYVRREIRDLTPTDLSTTMDAMYTLWSVSEKDGQARYGDDYHDSNYILRFHHFNAAWQDADHIHEGNGFMLQHLKMTNIVETAMQAVDPSVSLPYWDFTIESAQSIAVYNSPIMTPNMFGSMKQPSDMDWGYQSTDPITDGAIQDGRWAYIKADLNEDYPDLLYGYGYLRAPWNLNPSPYVSRFAYDYKVGTMLPTCNQHYTILQYTSLMDFMVDMEDGPHATTHALSGGIYGCDLMKPLLDAGYVNDEASLKTICGKWVFYMKEFYRYNYVVPNRSCNVSDDVQSSVCGVTCDEDSISLLQLNLKTKIANQIPSDIDTDGLTAWSDFICTGDGWKVFSGDHLESASPADPSFWVIHPTLERLLHAKLMAGGFENEKWASDPENDYVCNKAECYIDGVKGYHDECCYGHYKNDKLLDAVSGDRNSYTGPTNKATLKGTDPRKSSYSMTYVYDKFEWSHCTDSGYDFSSLLQEMYDTAFPSPTPKPSKSPKPTKNKDKGEDEDEDEKAEEDEEKEEDVEEEEEEEKEEEEEEEKEEEEDENE